MAKATGIICPTCGSGQTRVIDKRAGAGRVRRRRECVAGHRFTTYEVVEDRSTSRKKGRAKKSVGVGMILSPTQNALRKMLSTGPKTLEEMLAALPNKTTERGLAVHLYRMRRRGVGVRYRRATGEYELIAGEEGGRATDGR